MESNMGAADIMRKSGQRLLTADRIGIGLVIIGLAANRLSIFTLGLLGLGIFGPPLLRELGLLKDGDDYTRRAMHRAGFHTMILIVALLTANRILANYADSLPAAWGHHGLFFDLEFLVQLSLVVFTVSYVVQYLGPRQGVARVFAGLGLFTALQAVGWLFMGSATSSDSLMVSLTTLLIGAVFGGLAVLVAKKPRIGGGVLLALFALALVGLGFEITGFDSVPEHAKDQGIFWTYVMSLIWAFVFFGFPGYALFKNPAD